MNSGYVVNSFGLIGIIICLSARILDAEPVTVMGILKSIQNNHRMVEDVRADVTLSHRRVKEGLKKIEMIYYRRDCDDSFVIGIKAPEWERGNGYLRVKDNFWVYRRNTRTFQHINRDERIGGTDVQGDDFESRKIAELYRPEKNDNGKEKLTEERLGEIEVYKIEIRAISNDVDYPRKTLWVRKDTFLPLKEQAYTSNGTLMQTAYFVEYTKVKNSYIAVKQIFIDEFEKGNKTVVEISALSLEPIERSIFSKAFLENFSK